MQTKKKARRIHKQTSKHTKRRDAYPNKETDHQANKQKDATHAQIKKGQETNGLPVACAVSHPRGMRVFYACVEACALQMFVKNAIKSKEKDVYWPSRAHHIPPFYGLWPFLAYAVCA